LTCDFTARLSNRNRAIDRWLEILVFVAASTEVEGATSTPAKDILVPPSRNFEFDENCRCMDASPSEGSRVRCVRSAVIPLVRKQLRRTAFGAAIAGRN
jgi:hypothetical protein